MSHGGPMSLSDRLKKRGQSTQGKRPLNCSHRLTVANVRPMRNNNRDVDMGKWYRVSHFFMDCGTRGPMCKPNQTTPHTHACIINSLKIEWVQTLCVFSAICLLWIGLMGLFTHKARTFFSLYNVSTTCKRTHNTPSVPMMPRLMGSVTLAAARANG